MAMKARYLIGCCLGLLAMAALACSGGGHAEQRDPEPAAPRANADGGELTLEEYFQELRGVGDESRERQEEVAAPLEPVAARIEELIEDSPEQALQLLSEYYEALLPLAEESLDEPPPEVRAAHERFVQAAEDGLSEMQAFAGQLAAARSIDDVRDLDGSFEEQISEAAAALEPCVELQDIAIEHDIDVNLACGDPEDWDNPLDVTRRPEFLTPVAQSREVGITPYWMGKEFNVGAITVELTRDVEFYSQASLDPAFSASYAGWQEVPSRHIGMDVTTWHEGATELANRRRRVLDEPGATTAPVEVGPWPAELVSAPSGARLVNALILYIDVGDMTVSIITNSGTTGAPGTDSNPLIDSQLFIDTVAARLQPYEP